MIAYMEGTILKSNQDGIILLVGQIGYEILLPVYVMEKVINKLSDQLISLYIYYYQTERQPKPVLIGFNSEEEKDFFQVFISVDAIGPLKAVKAMERPISSIAMAIEQKDLDFLSELKGIGKRTAQKIVASLHGKVSRFIPESLMVASSENSTSGPENSVLQTFMSHQEAIQPSMKKISQQVVDVLVEQLGYTAVIARKMVSVAIENNTSISTPEQLFDVVLHGKD